MLQNEDDYEFCWSDEDDLTSCKCYVYCVLGDKYKPDDSYSKMILLDEMAQAGADYQRMQSVEFLDFLVRLAYLRFRSEAGLSFSDKLAKTLEILFMLVGQDITLP